MNDSQRKVLDLLEAAGERGATTGELVQLGAGNRFGARIEELRKMNYIIEAVRERQSSFRYRLLSSPGQGEPAVSSVPEAALAWEATGGLSNGRLFEAEHESSPHWKSEAA